MALTIAIVSTFLTQPVAAQTPSANPAAAVEHFKSFCSAEIARLRASGDASAWDRSADNPYFIAISRYFLPSARALPQEERLRQQATPAELRELGSWYLANAAPDEMNRAYNGVQECATRAALALLAGGPGRPSARPNAVTPRPSTPPLTAQGARAAFNAGNREEAMRQWRLLADRGDRDAAYYLALVYAGGAPGIARDPALAERYYAAAANAGLPKAQANYGLFLMQTNRRAEGLQWVERAARSGDAEAQWIVASGYWRGRGVERDLPRAQALMRLSAGQNFPAAVRDRPLVEAALAAEQQAQAPAPQLPAGAAPEVAAGGSPATPDPLRSRTILIHNPALDATSCVHVRPYGEPGSRGFSQSIVNQCGRVVEVSWCSTDGECERDSGNSWTLAASGQGSAYPVGRSPILYVACFGRNSGGFEQGSQGRRIVCTGEAGH